SKPPARAAPMSYSSAWPDVRTSTDSPWPTSSTHNSAWPGAGSPRCGHSSGSHSSSASGLPGTPRGSNSQNPPASASGNANHAGRGSQNSASGVAASHSNSGHERSKHAAASLQHQAPAPRWMASSAVPSSDSGTTTRLHHGIATRLASGPAAEAWPNKATATGSRPMVATACASTNPRTTPPSERGGVAGRHHSSQATPAKLSQNPAVSAASG